MAGELIARIANGDNAALGRAATFFRDADQDDRKRLLNGLAAAAPDAPGCMQALLQLIDDHHLDRPAIRRILVNNDHVENAHQDVLIAVAQSVHRFRADAAFTTWLHSVARNVAVDHLRRMRDTVPFDEETAQPATGASGGAAGRLSSMIASRSDLAAAVDALPEPFREAVVLRDIEQRTYAEIAESTGAEMNTVKSRISRGRALVASMMADDLFEHLPDADEPST
ncbi:MAG: RNA polymerase sigma factor [Actinomycetota bacterium]